MPRPPRSTLFSYTTLFRSKADHRLHFGEQAVGSRQYAVGNVLPASYCLLPTAHYSPSGSSAAGLRVDRKSTRLNSSHLGISYAVFCLKKKKTNIAETYAHT